MSCAVLLSVQKIFSYFLSRPSPNPNTDSDRLQAGGSVATRPARGVKKVLGVRSLDDHCQEIGVLPYAQAMARRCTGLVMRTCGFQMPIGGKLHLVFFCCEGPYRMQNSTQPVHAK